MTGPHRTEGQHTKAIEGILEEDFRDRILPFDRQAASTYAAIAAVRRAAGHPISQFDCQIAAIARAHGASVATRNTGDFEGCGVQLMDPWSHVDVHGLAPRRSMR